MLQAACILKGQPFSKKRSRSDDFDDVTLSQTSLHDEQQHHPLSAVSFNQCSRLRAALLPDPIPGSELGPMSQSVSPTNYSRVRTPSSGLRVPSQLSTLMAGGASCNSDSVDLPQSFGCTSLTNCTQDSQQVAYSSALRSRTQAVVHAVPLIGGESQCSQHHQIDHSSQESMGSTQPAIASSLSYGLDESPMTPRDSALLALLLIPDESPDLVIDTSSMEPQPKLHSSPDSVMSRHSCGARTLSHTTSTASLPYAADSQLLPQDSQLMPDSLLSQPIEHFHLSCCAEGDEYGLQESDLAMLGEALSEQPHPAAAQDTALKPQSSGQLLLSQPITTGSWPQAHSRITQSSALKPQYTVLRTESSGLETVGSEALCWPESGPYNLQRWQSVTLQ